MSISDERLAELVSKLEAHVGKLTEVQDDKCIIAALRELQRRRNPPQVDWQAGFVEISQCPPES